MTDDLVREIAKIERTHLGFEDHNVLTGFLYVNYGDTAQGIGGYSIFTVAGSYIERTLKACGVRAWEDLRGRTICVLTDGGRVVGIENLPTEPGGRFLFAEVFGKPS